MAAFVEGHRCSHFLQLPQWAKVKEAWQWQGILVYRQERIVGAMSVLIRALGLGLSVMYGPRGPVCDRDTMEQVRIPISELKEYIEKKCYF